MAEEDILRELIRKRGVLKAQLTRLENFLTLEGDKSPEEIKVRLNKIEGILDKFESVQFEIEAKPDSNSDSQEEERTLFENRYYKCVARAQKLINETTSANPNTNDSTITRPQSSTQAKLPEVNIPIFKGDSEDWLSFRDLFQSLIANRDDIPKILKFSYLKSSLAGEAAQVIQSLEITNENFDVAWNLLVNRFENKKLIIGKHVSALFKVPTIEKESAAQIRNLVDSALKHIRAIESLGVSTEAWDVLLIHLMCSKLDNFSLRAWENTCSSSELPTFAQLTAFLQQRAQTLESIEASRGACRPRQALTIPQCRASFPATSSQKKAKTCMMCSKDHSIYQCTRFLGLTVPQRIQEIIRLGLCRNCLRSDHWANQCTSGACKTCSGRHNTLLHLRADSQASDTKSGEQATVAETNDREIINTTSHVSGAPRTSTNILLATAVVHVLSSNGRKVLCRALLDSGSQSHFITERMAHLLGLKRCRVDTSVKGIAQASTKASQMVTCQINSRLNAFTAIIDCIILPKITQFLPAEPINTHSWDLPDSLELADPQFYKPNRVDMLIGAELFWKLLCIGQIEPCDSGGPLLQKTRLGWIVAGRCRGERRERDALCHLGISSEIDEQIKQFWEIEDCNTPREYSLEEKACEEHFLSSHQRESSGRFIVQMPFKSDPSALGDSLETAKRRFLRQEQRLQKNTELKNDYQSFMKEYEQLQHMEVIPDEKNSQASQQRTCYIPHFGVRSGSSRTTKLRVVFDASSKTESGVALNDILMVGPVVQDDLLSIIIRFRVHQYVMTADVEKMYRQVRLHPKQRDLLRILWRGGPSDPLKSYRLCTVTYGTASAPFLATRCLKQLAVEASSRYPEAAKTVERDFYVDDLLTGHDTLIEAVRLQSDIINILEKGQFNLRKWCANHPSLLAQVPEYKQELPQTLSFSDNQSIRTLGLLWNPVGDYFSFSVKPLESNHDSTKRKILADIFSLFDPLGLLSPITIRAKIIMQNLWQHGLGWDESLPMDLHTKWTQHRRQLEILASCTVQRKVVNEANSSIEQHGFSDASEMAYGAAVYVKSVSESGNTAVNLLCSKTKLAPLKGATTPRLELCGALLLSRLIDKVVRAIGTLRMKPSRIILWTDSTIVLTWIASPSRQWKTFVCNRVAEIQRLTPDCQWRHTPGKDNPADHCSRGLDPNELIHSDLWWRGPRWLLHTEGDWPKAEPRQRDIPERRTVAMIGVAAPPSFNIERFSSLTRATRVLAYCLRFIHRLKKLPDDASGPLKAEELYGAQSLLIKMLQQQVFKNEIQTLRENETVTARSQLRSLNPFLDDNELLRVGGRLRNANISYAQRHPIILPPGHLTTLIARRMHVENGHAPPQLLLACLRQTYWPLHGRNLARKIVRQCVTCFKYSAKTSQQLMGDLPRERVEPTKAFVRTGVDYAGPIYVRESLRRKSQTAKAYVAVFVCLATKAVHLEPVGSMSTDSFIAALKRFISRRGRPSHIFSDNGTNFIGAKRELSELTQLLNSSSHQNRVVNLMAQDFIQWSFIPPRAPHFGGLWEAAVKSFKFHLRRILGSASLTFEETSTILAQIEACMNSRPLYPLSSDPRDLNPITPGHFLIGDAMVALPEPNLTERKMTTLSRWQRVQQVVQHFWKRWSREYLNTLQQRVKWTKKEPNLSVGDLVLIKEDSLPQTRWRLGRISELFHGQDQLARVASVRTVDGTFKRPITKLCRLPVECHSDS